MGKGGETVPFMSHTWEKKLLKRKIDFVAFSSWQGHFGDWKILPSDLQVKTKDRSYKYYPKDLIDPIANSITTRRHQSNM